MLRNIDDDTVKDLVNNDILPIVIEKYFDKPNALQIEGCNHDFECADASQACKHCGKGVYLGATMRRACECGQLGCSGSKLRWNCTICKEILCSSCNAKHETQRNNSDFTDELVELMRHRHVTQPTSLDVVRELPDEPQLKRQRLDEMKASSEDDEAAAETEHEQPTNEILQERMWHHPSMDGEIEATELKQYKRE